MIFRGGFSSIFALLVALLVALMISAPVVRAEVIAPHELSKRVFNSNKYETDNLAFYRFNLKPDWGKGIRVNIAPGQNYHLGDGKYALYENRYFFLNLPRENILQNFDMKKLMGAKKEVSFSDYSTNDNWTSFTVNIDKSSFFLGTIIVSCTGTSELAETKSSYYSDFRRFQIRFKKCTINNKTTLLEDSWITLDAFRFETANAKSALVIRALHYNEAKEIEGRSFSQTDVANLILSVEDELLQQLFLRLGFKIGKSFLWKHQP